MMQTINYLTQDTRCHFCGQVFYCENCRDKHELAKHGQIEQKCPLCYSDKVQIKNFDDPKFLKHLIDHHFPLCCNLCGQVFRKPSDLQMFQKCNWKCISSDEKKDKSSNESPLQTLYTPSPVTRHMNYGSDLKKSLSEGLLLVNSKMVNINRFTSTPLQRSTALLENGAANIHFTLKTPKTPQNNLTLNSVRSDMSNAKQDFGTKYFSDLGSPSDSKYEFSMTGISNWKSCRSKVGDFEDECKDVDKSELKNDEESYSNSKSGSLKDDLLKTAPEYLFNEKEFLFNEKELSKKSYPNNSAKKYSENKTFDCTEKSTRGSIYFENIHVISHMSEQASNKDISHEAKSHMISKQSPDKELPIESLLLNEKLLNDSKISQDNETKEKINEKEKLKEEVELKEKEIHENKKDFTKCQDSGVQDKETQSTENEPPNKTEQVISDGSSNVIMMLIIQNNGTNFSSSDLQPLLESGLKQLTNKSNVCSEISTDVKLYAATTQKETRSVEDPKTVVNSVEEVNYMHVTKKNYMSPVKSTKELTIPSESRESNSLISSMTRVFMNAWKRVPDGMLNSLRGLSRMPAITDSPTSKNIPEFPSTNEKYATPLRRPQKRRREEIDTVTTKSPTKQSDCNVLNTSKENELPSLSPCAKKYRSGWIKIKPRPPIARMRRPTSKSSLHISSSTQCFQRGSLSVGNEVIPIPSRACEDKKNDNDMSPQDNEI